MAARQDGAMEAAAMEIAALNNIVKVQHWRIRHLEDALADALPPGRRESAYGGDGGEHRRITPRITLSTAAARLKTAADV